jgi:hypothetical protein
MSKRRIFLSKGPSLGQIFGLQYHGSQIPDRDINVDYVENFNSLGSG